MAMVNFKKGLLANLPSTYSEGTLYVTTDERAIYLDVSDEARVRLGDFQEFATLAALTSNKNPSTTALYYVADINCLAKWNGSEYIQINRDTGMTSVEVTGSGNAVTAAVYSEDGRKLILSKNATFATKAELDALDAYVGDIPDGYTEQTVIAYINKKAEETLNAASGGSSESAASVLGALNTYKAENDAKVSALEDKAHEHENKDVLDGITSEKVAGWDAEVGTAEALAAYKTEVTAALDGKQAVGDYATKAEAQAYADAKDAAIAAAKAAGDAAQADVDALEAKVGTVPADTTVVEMIAAAQTAATYDDTEVRGLISAADAAAAAAQDAADAAQGDVNVLKGDDAGKSVRTISAEEVAKIVAGADESYDTLKEIADWISNHADDAASMNSAILALQAIVDGIGDTENGEKATVVAYVTDAINALNIGDYALAADLTALAGRVATLEGKAHEHANKALLDTYTQTEEDLADAVSKKHTHDNKTVLDGITAEKVSNWDSAQAAAEATAADALAAAKTELEGKISAEQTRADTAEKANAAAIAAISADYLKAADKTELEGKITAEQTRATDAETALSERVDALEGIDHDAYKAYADQAEADAVNTAKANLEAALTWGSFTD